MIIKASELPKYMEIHNVDKIPVEVVDTELPENKDLRQGARHLAKRLIITRAKAGTFGGYYKQKGVEAISLQYAIYNSFRKSKCYVPTEWEFDVLAGDLGTKMLADLADHSGNLEKKFRETFDKVNPEIQEKIAAASKLLAEAEAISEKHGIPFTPKKDVAGGMALGYLPGSFQDIYGDLLNSEEIDGSEVVSDVTGVYQMEYTGWQNSSNSC